MSNAAAEGPFYLKCFRGWLVRSPTDLPIKLGGVMIELQRKLGMEVQV